jgi:hypothetical protein
MQQIKRALPYSLIYAQQNEPQEKEEGSELSEQTAKSLPRPYMANCEAKYENLYYNHYNQFVWL